MIGVGTENVALHRSNFEYIDLIGKFNKKIKTCVSYVHMCDCNVIKLVLIKVNITDMLLKIFKRILFNFEIETYKM